MDRLTAEHRAVARDVALHNANPSKIAELYEMNYHHVCRLLKDPLMMAEIDRVSKVLEDQMVKYETQARSKLYENLEAIMDAQINLALNAENDAVRSGAGNNLLRFALRMKGEDKEKANEQRNLAIQLSDLKNYNDDADANPAANPNVISILDGRAERDGTNDD